MTTAPQSFTPPTGMMPGYDAISVTPSDTVSLAAVVRALYVGAAGDVRLTTLMGNSVTFYGLQAGTILPMQTKQVLSASTTASLMVGIL
jgi:hypothetical protein